MRVEDITFGWFLSIIACLDSHTAITIKIRAIALSSELEVKTLFFLVPLRGNPNPKTILSNLVKDIDIPPKSPFGKGGLGRYAPGARTMGVRG